MRVWAITIALGVAALVAGCGGSSGHGKLLSQHQADQLRTTLAAVQENIAAKNCTAATQQASALQQQVDSYGRLDPGARSALRASARRLEQLVGDECQVAPVGTTQPPVDQTQTQTQPQDQAKKEKKPKKEKPPKDQTAPGQGGTPPGQDGQTPPSPQGGGGAGLPGENNQGGGGN